MRFVDDIAEHWHVSFNATTTAMEILLGPAFFLLNLGVERLTNFGAGVHGRAPNHQGSVASVALKGGD